MKHGQLLVASVLLAGCASPHREFVQGDIRILPPVTRNLGPPAISDGGTLVVPIRDANGRDFTIFIDHRMQSPSPGAIYLNAYPGEHNSIRVHDATEFKAKVGDFDYH